MKVYNVKNYKLAKIFSKDLFVIIKEIETSIGSLSPYSRYKPVSRVLRTLKDELAVLKSHQKGCEDIVTNKGQVGPEGKQG